MRVLVATAANLAGLVAFFVLPPWALTRFVGWPLPRSAQAAWALLSGPTVITIEGMVKAAACVMWLLWGASVLLLAATIIAAVLRLRIPLPRLPRPLRDTLTSVAGALMVTTTSANAAYAAAPPPATAAVDTPFEHSASRPSTAMEPAATTPTSVVADHIAEGDTPILCEGDHRLRINDQHYIYTVRKGQSLWRIAELCLGSGPRWTEIWHLNRGQPIPDGRIFRSPHLIYPGQELTLPGDATPPPDAVPTPPPADSSSPPAELTPTPAIEPSASPGTNARDGDGVVNPPASSTNVPSPPGTGTTSPAPSTPPTTASSQPHSEAGVTLPSRAWVSLALATAIAAMAALLRLQQRRRARLSWPIPVRTGRSPSPVPDPLRPADAAGSRTLDVDFEGNPLSGVLPKPPAVLAPIGLTAQGGEVSLFDVPGPGIALTGDAAVPAARAILAAVLSTGVTGHTSDRPLLVTTTQTLARLLPPDVVPAGLDPDHETFGEERLIVTETLAQAVIRLEEEMIHRRRLLDDMDEQSIADLNARDDHAEHQPAFVLLAEADDRYAARIAAVAHQRADLYLHLVLLGESTIMPCYQAAADGSVTVSTTAGDSEPAALTGGRLATLTATDLASVLDLVREAAPRPEPGFDLDDPFDDDGTAPPATGLDLVDLTDIPAPTGATPAPIRLTVLGPPTLATEQKAITSGVRTGSYAVLALLAAHPHGRTLDQLAADLHPDAEPDTGRNRVHTDIVAARAVLRETTGITGRGRLIVHDTTRGGRYRIDPDLIEVDLWRMLAAIDRANNADDDIAALAALHEAAAFYQGDFAAGQDRAWALDYAATYRHQILGVYARIAELLETDHPDQAVAALEKAIEYDPVNEELYQRVMRIHGRQQRPDAVRRTLRLLEDRLFEIGEAEPSEATRRVAARQFTGSPSLR